MKNNTNEELTEKKKPRKVVWISIAIVLLCIVVLAIYLVRTHNANSQIRELKSNIEHKNVGKVANQLSNKDTKMTDDQAAQLIKYLNAKPNNKRFNKEINNVLSNTNNKKTNNTKLGKITNSKGEPIITFSKNGKQYLILDKIAMDVNYKPIYIQEGQFSSEYKSNGSNTKISEPNKLTYIGSFVDGNYKIPVTKIMDNGPIKDKINGYLQINTTDTNKDGKILAKQLFKQAQFKVILNNDSKIDDKSKKIVINGQEYNYENGKVYGYIPVEQDFKVYAKGTLGKHSFETKPGNVFYHSNHNTQVVELFFNQSEIDKKLKEDKEKEKKKHSKKKKEKDK